MPEPRPAQAPRDGVLDRLHAGTATVAVVGLGHVGLVTAACLAGALPVRGLDVDPERVAAVRDRRPPFLEPGLDGLLLDAGDRLDASVDPAEALRDAAVVLLCVPTPDRGDGEADLTWLHAALDEVARHAARGAVVAVRSTVPPGTGDDAETRLSAAGRDDLAVVSVPEFLAEGTAVRDLREGARLVVGGAPGDRRVVRAVFEAATRPREVVETDRRTAELAKYAANTFLAARVSLVNEFARLCDAVGADVTDLARVVGLDPRVGSRYLRAGAGYGGSCFPKDLPAVAAVGDRAGAPMPITRAVHAGNEAQWRYVADRALERTRPGDRVAVWGLAFKPETSDVRSSPALRVVDALLDADRSVACHDPAARDAPAGALRTDGPLDALDGAALLLHLTEWPVYRAVSPGDAAARMARPVLLDGRNALDLAAWRAAGFDAHGVGTGTGRGSGGGADAGGGA